MTARKTQSVSELLQRAAACHRANDLVAAEQGYRAVLQKRPDDPDALYLLGLIEEQRGNVSQARVLAERAVHVRDDFPDAHQYLGKLAGKAGDLAAAEYHFRRSLHYRPAFADGQHNLGLVLMQNQNFVEAAQCFRAAIQLDPGYAAAYRALARTARISNDIAGIESAARSGLALSPEDSVLHVMAAEAAFAQGLLPEGWSAYEHRFQSRENPVAGKSYPLPWWRGEDLTDRRLLIWGEQGLGDEIMYANMFGDAISRAAACGIQCSPRLADTFRRSFPRARIFDRDLTPAEVLEFDFQSPAGSLGLHLRRSVDAFPTHSGYLVADEARAAALRETYKAHAPGNIVVGIAWRTAEGMLNATDKSVGVLDWGPIFHVPGVTFVNLQYGDVGAELDAVQKGFGKTVIADASVNPLGELSAYVAQVAAMDIVISSSNTAAHVAGALGRPVLCMLPSSLGRGRRWYWFSEQQTCPWYPSLSFFKQRQEGEWRNVIRDVGLALLEFSAVRGAVKTAPYLRSMAMAFASAGQMDDAIYLYERLSQQPGCAAEAYFHIGGLKTAEGDTSAALAMYDKSIAFNPAFAHAYNAKGMLLKNELELDAAIAAYREGLRYAPDLADLHNNLGTALRAAGRPVEALPHYEEARRLRPDLVSILFNLAGARDELGDSAGALADTEEVLRLNPAHTGARDQRAQILLSLGQFTQGWLDAPARLARPNTKVSYQLFPYPAWKGGDLSEDHVLVWTEQGIGDEILTASMLPDLIDAAKRVTILCSTRLVPLFRRSFPAAAVEDLLPILQGAPLPVGLARSGITCQMSQSDLGAAFRKSFDDFPARGAFLKSKASRRDSLRARYAAHVPGNRIVGISWMSGGNYEVGWLKSQNLMAWAPILTVPGITFVDLQYGDRKQDRTIVRDRLGVEILHDPDVDSTKDIDLFAAQVAAMDLVVSVSNTTVHVAGAQDIPAWVLLAEGRGRIWYWFRDRADSPWYRSLRLLRQPAPGQWLPVIEQCAADLRAWAAPARG